MSLTSTTPVSTPEEAKQSTITEDVLTSLPNAPDSFVTQVRKRKTHVREKEPIESVDEFDEEIMREIGLGIGVRGGRSYTELKNSNESDGQVGTKNGTLGTDHKLLDHSFSQEGPSETSDNFASKLVGVFQRSTSLSDVLDSHDAENDPSQAINLVNYKAKEGVPVIPTIKCDIVFRLSKKTKKEVLAWFKEELHWAGLTVRSEIGYSGDFFVKVTADRRIFLKGAESMELLKRVHPDRGDGMKPFSRNKVYLFCPRQSTDGFLSAAERQLILYDKVTRMRTDKPVTVGNVKLRHHESVVSGLISSKVIKQIYPLHQKSKQDALNRLWVWNLLGTQPLNLIRHYFGDEIALYFAWLGTYTSILVVPLVVGIFVGLVYDDNDVNSADWCFTFYAFFNVVWPTLFLEIWKRRSASLAWEWGTLGHDIETQEIQRPQFHGTLGENPITGEVELQYSDVKRQVKQIVSLVVSMACLVVVLFSMLAIFRFDNYVQDICRNNTFPDFVPSFLTRFVKYAPKILLPISVSLMDVIYSNIAEALNNWENYKYQRTYDNWLVLKLILFKFINSFLALFYTAFYLQDFQKLEQILATLLITKQIVGNCGEILGPVLKSWAKVWLLRTRFFTDEEGDEKLSQVETESEKPRYDSCFDDYLEMFIQMGYVILFSAAYPMAAVWAFLNNVVEIRGDAFKLVNGLQRPFIKRVEDIGFWQDAFEVLSVIAIVVNCALIGIRGQVERWFPSWNIGEQILFVIFMEHLFLSIKFIIDRAIPDVPDWVTLASAKERYNRNRALKRFEKLMQTTTMKGQVQLQKDMEVKSEERKLEGREDEEGEIDGMVLGSDSSDDMQAVDYDKLE